MIKFGMTEFICTLVKIFYIIHIDVHKAPQVIGIKIVTEREYPIGSDYTDQLKSSIFEGP